MKTIRKTAESGMAIILALILLAIFMILAFAFTARAIAAGRSASHSAGELQAQASCDAALESCIQQMRTKFDNSAASSLPEGDAAWLSSVDFEKGSGTAFTLPSNASLKSKIKVLGNNLASSDKMNTVANDNLGINFFNVGSFAPDSSGTSLGIGARHFLGLSRPSRAIISTSVKVLFLRNPHLIVTIETAREVHSCEISAFLPKLQSIRPGRLTASGWTQEWTFIVGFGRRWRRAQGRE